MKPALYHGQAADPAPRDGRPIKLAESSAIDYLIKRALEHSAAPTLHSRTQLRHAILAVRVHYPDGLKSGPA